MKNVAAAWAAFLLCGLAAIADAQAGGLDEFVGVWQGDEMIITFFPEGYAVPVDKASGATIAVVKAGAADGKVTFHDLAGPMVFSPDARKCVMENDGVYSYEMKGDTVTFTLAKDPCEDRIAKVNGQTFTRMPPPASE